MAIVISKNEELANRCKEVAEGFRIMAKMLDGNVFSDALFEKIYGSIFKSISGTTTVRKDFCAHILNDNE